MIDLAGISGVVGAAAGAVIAAAEALFVGSGRAGDGAGKATEAAGGSGLSAATALALSVVAAAIVMGVAAGGGALICETVGGSAVGCGAEAIGAEEVEAEGAEVEEVEAEGVEAEEVELAEVELAAGGGEAAAAFWRTIDPVTESRPCSRTVIREYNRSRSRFNVSMADANRLVSFWLSFATHWICCDCRTRSAEAACSRRNPTPD